MVTLFVLFAPATRLPDLRYQRTATNLAILEACPALGRLYSACPFLTNCHAETIFSALFRKDPGVRRPSTTKQHVAPPFAMAPRSPASSGNIREVEARSNSPRF